MKRIGYLLLTVGFLAGSLVATRTAENSVEWGWFAPAFLLLIVGVALARVAVRGEAQHDDKLSTDVESLRTSIERIVDNIRRLDTEKAEMNPYDAHGRIDALFLEDLNTFVEARRSIGHVHGLQAFADVMNEFAAGERYLNRVWSASVDGYVDEVQEYIGRAREQFEKTRDKLQALGAGQ